MTTRFDIMMKEYNECKKKYNIYDKNSKINAINNPKRWTKCLVLSEDKKNYVNNVYIFDYPLDQYTTLSEFKNLIEVETGKKIKSMVPEDKYKYYLFFTTVQRGKIFKITFEN